jgi:hypothetical protein
MKYQLPPAVDTAIAMATQIAEEQEASKAAATKPAAVDKVSNQTPVDQYQQQTQAGAIQTADQKIKQTIMRTELNSFLFMASLSLVRKL